MNYLKSKRKEILGAVGILCGMILVSALVGIIAVLISNWRERSDASSSPASSANYPHLADNLQNDLNSALSPEFPFSFDSAGNPFTDNSGLSRQKSDGGGGGNNSQVNLAVKQTSGGQVPVSGNYSTMPFPTPNSTTNPQPNVQNIEPFPTDTADSKKLLQERNRRLRQGQEVEDESRVYSVSEVRPIGVIGTRDRNRIWLYSTVTKQTFSVKKGTRLRDGVIEGVTADGVQFRRDDGSPVESRWMKRNERQKDDDADSPVRVPVKEEQPRAPEQVKIIVPPKDGTQPRRKSN